MSECMNFLIDFVGKYFTWLGSLYFIDGVSILSTIVFFTLLFILVGFLW